MKNYTFSHLLKVTRMRNGFDQAEFARRLGVSQSTYSRYEKGKSDPPFSLIQKLVKDYEFPVNLILYSDLSDLILNFPLKLLGYHLFENEFDFNPVRRKSNKRKNDDMSEILSEIISLVGQAKLRYESVKVRNYLKILELVGYDIDKVSKTAMLVAKAYRIEE